MRRIPFFQTKPFFRPHGAKNRDFAETNPSISAKKKGVSMLRSSPSTKRAGRDARFASLTPPLAGSEGLFFLNSAANSAFGACEIFRARSSKALNPRVFCDQPCSDIPLMHEPLANASINFRMGRCMPVDRDSPIPIMGHHHEVQSCSQTRWCSRMRVRRYGGRR